MAKRERWAFVGSLIVHLAIVFFVGSRLVSPARVVNRVEIDLQGMAASSTAPGLEAPVPSRAPSPPAAGALPARPTVALQMVSPSTVSLPPAQDLDADGSLAPPAAPALPGQSAVALTWPGDKDGTDGADGGGVENPDGGSGGGGSGRGGPDGSTLQGYFAAVRMRVDAAKRYPKIAEQRRIQGKVLVFFSLNVEGELLGEPELLQSSGYGLLDRAALQAVRRGAPYPKFPGKAEELPGVLQMEVTFVLH
jgi:protein TonB